MKEQFGSFTATELYCPKCKSAQPVREKLLLVLPAGELHEYLCSGCGTSLGERTTTGATKPVSSVRPRLAANPKRRLLR
jgi:transposase-like protein